MDVVRITGMAFFNVKTGFMDFFLMSILFSFFELFIVQNVTAVKIQVRASFSKMTSMFFKKSLFCSI